MNNSIFVTAYHGSGTQIIEFDYQYTNQGNDQIGSGFYFTSSLKQAIGYTTAQMGDLPKLGGVDTPTVHVVNLAFSKLLDAEHECTLSAAQVRKFLLRSPTLDKALEDWGDVEHEGRAKVLARAAEGYVHKTGDGPLIKRLHHLSNDFFPKNVESFNRALKDVLGYDGFTTTFKDVTHYVALFPEQIEIIELLDREQANARLNDEIAEAESTKTVRDKIK